ncbi:MAG TPA: WG repeat-containing protein [Candidatus Obscuribacter sp.]|nr:WG repeat-containing protein [Candidatus Obscuribacter sp.]
MAKKGFQRRWVFASTLTLVTLLVSPVCAVGQEDKAKSDLPKTAEHNDWLETGKVRRGLKAIQYYFLAEAAAKNCDLRTVLECHQLLQQYTPRDEAQGYLTAVQETLVPKYPVDRKCLELYEKAVAAKGDEGGKQSLSEALIRKYPKFEYGYLLRVNGNPFGWNKEADNSIYKQVHSLNPNNALILAALCAKAYQNYEVEQCRELYLRLRKLNPYFKGSELRTIDSAYEQWQLTNRQKTAPEDDGAARSPFEKPRPKFYPRGGSLPSGASGKTGSLLPSFMKDAEGKLIMVPEELQKLVREKKVKVIERVKPTIAFIDKSGVVAFDPGPNVSLGRCYQDGMLVVNASEGHGSNCNNGRTQYWNSKGELAIDATFSDGKSSTEGLCAIEQNNRWGFVDHEGKVVIDCKYLEVKPFRQGLAAVRNAQGWGFINRSGVLVAEHIYTSCLPFSEGLAAVKLGDRIGYIDTDGILTIPATFTAARSFNSGVARVRSPQIEGLDGGGYIDKSGRHCIDLGLLEKRQGPDLVLSLMSSDSDSDDQISSGSFGYMNVAFMSLRSKSQAPEDFAEGLLPFKLEQKVGYVDITGKVVIEPQFDKVEPFSEGLAKVIVGNRSGFIDKSGKFIISPRYRGAGSFSEGLAAVSEDGENWGYIDTSGRLAIPSNYAMAERFSGGMARVGILPEKLTLVTQTNRDDNASTLNAHASTVDLGGTSISLSGYEAKMANSIREHWQCQEAIPALKEQFAFKLTKKGLPYDLQITQGMVDYAAIVSTIDAILLAAPYQSQPSSVVSGDATMVCTVTGSSNSPQVEVKAIRVQESPAQVRSKLLQEALKAIKYPDSKPHDDKIIRLWMMNNVADLCQIAAQYPDSPEIQARLALALDQIGLDSRNTADWLALARACGTSIFIERNPDTTSRQGVNASIGAFSQAYMLSHNKLYGLELSRAWADSVALQVLAYSKSDPLMLGTAAALSDNWSAAREQYLKAQAKQSKEATALLERLDTGKDQPYRMPSIKAAPQMMPGGTKNDLSILRRWLPVDTESLIANRGLYKIAKDTPSNPLRPPDVTLVDTLRRFCCGPIAEGADQKQGEGDKGQRVSFDKLEFSAGIMAGRNFKLPNGLGCGASSGATILVLSRRDFAQTRAVMSSLKAKANLCTRIGGIETLVFHTAGGRFEQGGSKYVFAPMEGVIVQANDKAYMLEMLERLKCAPAEMAFAEIVFDIKDLQTGCESWAVRKVPRSIMPFDYTSRDYIKGRPGKDEDDGFRLDRRFVGTVVSIKPDNVVNIKLIGGDSESLKEQAKGWKRLLTSDSTSAGYLFNPDLKQDAQTVKITYKANSVEIEQKCKDYQSAMFGLALLSAMGYVVFL